MPLVQSVAAIVLAGGRARSVGGPVVVVAAPGQDLPATNVNLRADYERAHALPAPPISVRSTPDPELPLVASDHLTLNWNTS